MSEAAEGVTERPGAASAVDLSARPIRFLWLEITGKCQLECVHCYADSGPDGDHGTMSTADWLHVLNQARELGIRAVQFIGGEPTLHTDLAVLIAQAVSNDLEVEVFSNLVHIPAPLWSAFSRPGVRLACSYYSDSAAEHAAITRRPSHARTRANIIEALRRSIPLRVGVVGMSDGQRTDQAIAELRALGVTDVGYDHLRQFGRGASGPSDRVEQLCGHCGDGVMAIGPTGDVWPCVFSRWMPVGNVREIPLSAVLASQRSWQVRAELSAAFEVRGACVPEMCDPQCGPSCSPACRPAGNCRPVGGCIPDYGPIQP